MKRFLPLLTGLFVVFPAWADDEAGSEDADAMHVVMHKNPGCMCCDVWVDGYFVEGHVPANDILRLLKERPESVTGVAVPGMPLGSPGMEHPRPQNFNTIALMDDGMAYIFESHEAGDDFSKKNDDSR